MSTPDPTELVRHGYDAVSRRYRRDDDPAPYAAWLTSLRQRIPPAAAVLDIGCGCGIPIARTLTEKGHHVTGVDLSGVQIERARHLVPQATFLRADAGLDIESEEFVPEADGGHQLFWRRKPSLGQRGVWGSV